MVTDSGTNMTYRDFRIQIVDGDRPPVLLSATNKITILEDEFAYSNHVAYIEIRGVFEDAQGQPISYIVDPNSIVDKDNILNDETEPPRGDTQNSERIKVRFRPDSFGEATFRVSAMSSGMLSTNTAEIILSVLPVNDPPSLKSAADLNLIENGAQTNFIVNILNLGPTNEISQKILEFDAVALDQASSNLFVTPLPFQFIADSNQMQIQLTLQTNRSGIGFIAVKLKDDGGVENGGKDSTNYIIRVVVENRDQPPVVIPGKESISLTPTVQELITNGYTLNISMRGIFDDADGDPILPVIGSILNIDGIIDNSIPDAIRILNDTNLTISIKIKADVYGAAQLDVFGLANGKFSTDSCKVRIQITPLLGSPYFDPIPTVTLTENSASTSVRISGIKPGLLESGATKVVSINTLLLDSSPSNLLSRISVDYTPGAVLAQLHLQPTQSVSGQAKLRLTVLDDGTNSALRTNAFSREVSIQVANLDDLPQATTNRT